MTRPTALTEMFGIDHPVLLAPMAGVSGGQLAKAVSEAGGLGLVAAGYDDIESLNHQLSLTGDSQVGIGCITWMLTESAELLHAALDHRPAAIWLSFGDPTPFVSEIHDAGSRLICQVHTVEHARNALRAGADVLVAQGTEAGGHGSDRRATFTLVPEVADLAAGTGVPVLAAGGVADGRGLAAALTLGADGVAIGSRFVASQESLVSAASRELVISTGGDDTVRTHVYDIAREVSWPAEYTGRLIRNQFIDSWHGREDELTTQHLHIRRQFAEAVARDDFDMATVHIGESAGLIHEVLPAATIVENLLTEADRCLRKMR